MNENGQTPTESHESLVKALDELIKIQNLDYVSHLVDLKVSYSRRQGDGSLGIVYEAWCGGRFRADSLPELLEKVRTFDPVAAERQRKLDEIERLKAEVAKLESATCPPESTAP